MKDYQEHYRDIINEHRKGNHEIQWVYRKENQMRWFGHTKEGIFRIQVRGAVYLPYKLSFVERRERYYLTNKGILVSFSHKKTTNKDKDCCQKWYLKYLAKERYK